MPAVTAARVTVIPAKKDRLPINVLSSEARKLRVAAYFHHPPMKKSLHSPSRRPKRRLATL